MSSKLAMFIASLAFSVQCLGVVEFSSSGVSLEEVTITVQRREESVQDATLSVFALTEESLAIKGINSIETIGAAVPGLNIDRFPQNNQALTLFIRGVGISDTQITQDPAVGVYLNGIYLARSTGLTLDVADLERVEVLRGPQGALYGRNTTGGAINLITAMPDLDANWFEQSFNVGSYGLKQSKSILNWRVSDQLATKSTWFYESADGYIENRGQGGDFGQRTAEAARIDIRWQPFDSVWFDYAFDTANIELYNLTMQAVSPREQSSGNALLDFSSFLSAGLVESSASPITALRSPAPMLPTDTEIEGHTLIASWQKDERTFFKSLTAYRRLDDRSYLDLSSGSEKGLRLDYNTYRFSDGTVLPATRPYLRQTQFSQEFQLIGSLKTSVDYIFGVFYFRESASESSLPLHHVYSLPITADNIFDLLGAEGSSLLGGQVLARLVDARAEQIEIKNEAMALYGQFDIRPRIFNERVELGIGFRHSRDSRYVDRYFFETNFLEVGGAVIDNCQPETLLDPLLLALEINKADFCREFDRASKIDFSDDSLNFSASYLFQDDLKVYTRYAQAYKSGGFNIRDPDETAFALGFGEEKVSTLELGMKSELLDRRLRLNAALFSSRFQDYQHNFLLPGSVADTRVVNFDNVDMRGLEFDLTGLAISEVMLGFSYSYLDSEIDRQRNPLSGEIESVVFPSVPRHSYSASIDYFYNLSDLHCLQFHLSYSFVDERKNVVLETFRDDYDLLDVRLALLPLNNQKQGLSAAIWAKNLADNDYVTFAVDNLPQAGRAVQWGAPRTFGFELSYRFY